VLLNLFRINKNNMKLESLLLENEINVKQLFNNENKELYKENIKNTIDYILDFLNNDKFYSGVSVTELKDKFSLINKNEDLSVIKMDEALEQLKEVFLDHAISFNNPTYVAHLNCPVTIPSLVGDLIASAVNTAVETWDQSTSATLIEQYIIDWITEHMKLPTTSDGVFTSGGTQSNFMGLLLARDHYAFKYFGINIKEKGWDPIISKFRFFCSEKAHFSIKKNAALLGMGYNSVIPVATNESFEMDSKALVLAIEKEKQKGNIPIGVIATIGTTDFGSFDPVLSISKITKMDNMWLHVDGAYGGCFVLSELHKPLFNGVQYADSITIDFHKSLFQPVSSSAFLVSDKLNFRYVSHYADYLNPIETKDSEHVNLITKSIQTTRRFDALKLWFTLKVTGEKTLGSYLKIVHKLAVDTYALLNEDSNFETIHSPTLSTVVFRYKAKGIVEDSIHDMLNIYIKNSLFKEGKASVASTKHNNITYLKFTLLNPNVTLKDMKNIVNMIKEKAANYNKNN